MSENIFLLTITIPLGTILLIFAMKYLSAIQQARARIAGDEAYRQLASQAIATQADMLARLASMEAGILDIKTRVAATEKMLREVE